MHGQRTATLIAAAALLTSLACGSTELDDYEMVSRRAELRSSDPMIPSEVYLVRTHGSHRIRIERICGPEHCGTIGFLEYLTGDFPRTAEFSTEIRELSDSVAAFVRDVVVVETKSGYAFDLVAEDSHVGGPLFTLRVTPTTKLEYTAKFTAQRDITTPGPQ